MTTSRRLDPRVRVAAFKLCLAMLDGRPRSAEQALKGVDAAEVARMLAVIAGELGRRVYGSKTAFRAECQRTIRVLEAGHAPGNGVKPD